MIIENERECGENKVKKEQQGNSAQQISNALYELLKFQEFIIEHETPFFGNLLEKLVAVDTIPFLLMTKDGCLNAMGIGAEGCFLTKFFRIEAIEEGANCATISLLRAFDICGEETDSIYEVMKLKKTDTCIEIDLSCICGIQIVDIDLLKRKIIIEPKC